MHHCVGGVKWCDEDFEWTHLTGLGSSLELSLSGSLGGPSLLEESLWDGDLLN